MYKVWNETDIRNVLNEISEKMGINCDEVPIIINKKLKKIKGRCWTKKVSVDGKSKIICTKLEFSELLINGSYEEKNVVHTIIHEYVHLYTDIIENKMCGHNNKFKENCIKAGIVADTYIPYEINENEYKYTVICKSCGQSFNRYRLKCNIEKYEKQYCCSKCRGSLKVKINY